jgi:Serine-threonine protein kinase 19
MKRKLPAVVVTKCSNKVRRSTVAVNPRPRKGGVPRLPLHTYSSETVVVDHDDHNDEFDRENDDIIASTLPSEAMLAFQSLQQSTDTCLSIPVSGTASVIHGVLDCQLHEWFTLTNRFWSTRMVEEQLQLLRQANTLRSLAIPNTNRLVWITTSDYIRAVSESIATKSSTRNNTSNENSEKGSDDEEVDGNDDSDASLEMVQWWIRYISQRPSDRFRTRDLEEAWQREQKSTNRPRTKAPRDIVPWLQRHQFILAASKDHTTFQLWLPGWGSSVLLTLLQTEKDVLSFLRRSRAKERSLSSLLERMPQHSSAIPIEAVVIPYLVAQGYVQRIARPSGLFLKLLATSC